MRICFTRANRAAALGWQARGRGLGLGSAGVIAARVAEDPAWEHHECLRGRSEVQVPAGLVKNASEYLGKFLRFGFVCCEFEGGPGARLVKRGALGLEPADLADNQLQVLQIRSTTEALGYQGALDHELPLPRCPVMPQAVRLVEAVVERRHDVLKLCADEERAVDMNRLPAP
jgi:hypothetical protein